MNDSTALLSALRTKISAEVDIEAEGLHRYIVYTPFMFDDGDHYVVILRKEAGSWVLSDEGHTFMHLSYAGIDLTAQTRSRIIEESLASHGVQNVGGELRLAVPDEDFGNALFSFMQALARTTTVAQITRERVASAFMEDFSELISVVIPPARRTFEWHDHKKDPDGHYVVDCRINGQPVPWFVFAVNSTDKCRNTAITCLTYEKWDYKFRRLVIFEDQQDINRKALAQLSDVVDKQFSSLGDKERIESYLKTELLN